MTVFKKGDLVKCVDKGQTYPGFEDMARKLEAKDWGSEHMPKDGDLGRVIRQKKNYVLVRFSGSEHDVVIDKSGLKLMRRNGSTATTAIAVAVQEAVDMLNNS
ncbi:hypothetical protein LCGC14_2914890 [marine sediment metagenome]|uniref:Uncharacterized protein n=1 Tax=marine sediment metagenome TaxID=412755 RepID=A0A0F8XQK0_9ZZZZ